MIGTRKEEGMLGEQNNSVTLADIQNEIKSMRKEAQIQYRYTLYFSGFGIAVAVALLGVSIYTMTLVSPRWQVIDGIGILLLGIGFAVYCWSKRRGLRREVKKKN